MELPEMLSSVFYSVLWKEEKWHNAEKRSWKPGEMKNCRNGGAEDSKSVERIWKCLTWAAEKNKFMKWPVATQVLF